MGQPITWQNVVQGDVGNAWRAMDSAQRSFNGAFDGLQGQVTKSEDIQAKNDVAIKGNNSQDYLNKLALLGKTPEDLALALKDGRVDALKASYGNAINHDQVRGAGEALLDQRYKQNQEAINFKTVMRNEITAPHVDKLRQALLTGDTAAEAEARKSLSDNGYRDFATQDGFARNLQHENLTRDEQKKGWVRDQGTYDRQGVMQDANIENMRGTLANARAQTGIQAGSLKLQGKVYDMNLQDHLDSREAKAIEALGKSQSANAASTEGTAAAMTAIESAFKGDDSGATNARKAYVDIITKYPGISTAAATQAVLAQDNSRYLKNDAWVRSNTVDRAGSLAGTDESKLRQLGDNVRRDASMDQYSRSRDAALNGPLATLQRAAISPPGTPNPVDAAKAAAARLRAEAATPKPTAAPVVVTPSTSTAPSPLLGGPRVGAEVALPFATDMASKGTPLTTYLKANNKVQQLAEAGKKAEAEALSAKLAKAKSESEIRRLTDAAKSIKPEDLQ